MGQEGLEDNYTHVEASFGTEGMESVSMHCKPDSIVQSLPRASGNHASVEQYPSPPTLCPFPAIE